jgi:hypothetical protein
MTTGEEGEDFLSAKKKKKCNFNSLTHSRCNEIHDNSSHLRCEQLRKGWKLKCRLVSVNNTLARGGEVGRERERAERKRQSKKRRGREREREKERRQEKREKDRE